MSRALRNQQLQALPERIGHRPRLGPLRTMTTGTAVAAMATLPLSGLAADTQEAASDFFQLGVIEIIGKSEPEPNPLLVDTVDAATLKALHRHDLGRALELLPGVTLQNVGQRRERLVSVRGFNSRQVPLFIDGVPVYVPYDGNVDLSRFGVDYVSQITVSKGLASVLYGPNTLGGAINVVSRKPSAPLEGSIEASTEMGESSDSLQTRYVASVGGLRGQWYAHGTASYVDSEGYTLPDDFRPTANEDGAGRENADSRDVVLSAKIGYLSTNGDEYALSLYRQDGDKNVPPYAGTAPGVQARFWQWPYWDKQSIYFTARNEVTPDGTLRWRIYHDKFRNALDSFDNATYSSFNRPYAFEGSTYDDFTVGGNADFEWRWTDAHTTRTALHLKRDVHREVDEVAAPSERYEDRTYALAIEHGWEVAENVVLTPGYAYTVQDGREAENNVNGTVTPFPTDKADAHNAQLTLAWTLSPETSVLAGVSRKTRFPTIKDRFSFRLGSAVPNPGLGPERAMHYEIGLEQRHAAWGFRAAVFQADLDDAIENVSIAADLCTAPNPTCFQQQNIGEQRNRGFELSVDYSPLATLRFDAQASIVDRDNRSRPELRQTDTPERKYRLGVQWDALRMLTLKADAQHESKRFSTTDGTRVADDFSLVNAFVRYEPVPQWGIEVGVRNLTDELYAYQEGFYEAGRTWLAQLDYSF